MKTRYSYGGDEHISLGAAKMSLEHQNRSPSPTVKRAKIKGVTEICPANASFQIKFNPDVIKPADMMKELKAIEKAAAKTKSTLKTRIIEIPVFYNDPWTHETLMRFRERHQDPTSTDIEYTARINHLDGVDGFIKAHSGAPWFVSMVDCCRIALSPDGERSGRSNRRSICGREPIRPNDGQPWRLFRLHYSVRAPGLQMFGITPMPIMIPTEDQIEALCLFKPIYRKPAH
jgi:urea carboxylase